MILTLIAAAGAVLLAVIGRALLAVEKLAELVAEADQRQHLVKAGAKAPER